MVLFLQAANKLFRVASEISADLKRLRIVSTQPTASWVEGATDFPSLEGCVKLEVIRPPRHFLPGCLV